MRYYAIGDIHGNLLGLEQVLSRSPFNPKEDTLLLMGDYVDGHSQSSEVVDFIINNIPNRIALEGNHDVWAAEWLRSGVRNPSWLELGGRATIESYLKTGLLTEDSHRRFFANLHPYYLLTIGEEKYAFVHGGWKSREGLGHDEVDVYLRDRTLWSHACSKNPAVRRASEIRTEMYDKVFIGHTTTEFDLREESQHPPVKRGKIINLDQGGGWSGWITLCDIETEECWQSDRAVDLYGKPPR